MRKGDLGFGFVKVSEPSSSMSSAHSRKCEENKNDVNQVFIMGIY